MVSLGSLGPTFLSCPFKTRNNHRLRSDPLFIILWGIVQSKTNHELATEMGFSVSTIRHETMRIYQALSVSDRKEAAKKAIMLSLV